MKRKVIIVISVVFALLTLSACNRNAAEVIEGGKVIISKDGKSLLFEASLNDKNLEPNTPFFMRYYIETGKMREAIGTDMVFVEQEWKRGKKAETYTVAQSVELKDPSLVEEISKLIENKEEKVVKIEVLNEDGMIDDQLIHKVEMES